MSKEVRQALADCGRRIVEKGLVVGPGGNVSVRVENTFFITPYDCALDEISPDEIAHIGISDGKLLTEGVMPSEEVLMHIGLYRLREDIGAVVHAHPPMVVAAASGGIQIRAMFPDFARYLGTHIPAIEYITPTTLQLADHLCDVMEGSDSAILKNHGIVTAGRTLRDAFYRAVVLEESARMQLMAQLTGQPRFITEAETQEIFAYHTETHLREILHRMQRPETSGM